MADIINQYCFVFYYFIHLKNLHAILQSGISRLHQFHQSNILYSRYQLPVETLCVIRIYE